VARAQGGTSTPCPCFGAQNAAKALEKYKKYSALQANQTPVQAGLAKTANFPYCPRYLDFAQASRGKPL
jgi:hypothetical protein